MLVIHTKKTVSLNMALSFFCDSTEQIKIKIGNFVCYK